MNRNGTLLPIIDRVRTQALVVGVLGAALTVVLAYLSGWNTFQTYQSPFYRAYLFSFLFLFGLSLGSLALLMVHRQLGGAWGFLIRRPLESGAMMLPLMLVLFVPILANVERVYPWASAQHQGHGTGAGAETSSSEGGETPHGGRPAGEGVVKADEHGVAKGNPAKVTPHGAGPGATGLQRDPLEHGTTQAFDFKKHWLNPFWFAVRVAIYFGIWIVLALIFNIGSRRQDETGSANLAYGLQSLSAPGLVIYFLSASFALIDWGMSLEHHWYSTIYGVLIIIGQAVSTVAFMIGVAAVISRRGETEGLDTPETFNDLGNLLLAFVMLWAYVSFSQFLIIWAGNLAEEIPWYMRRLHGGWEWIGRFLMLFHFFVPFLILLSRPTKRRASWLWKVAALVFVAHIVNDYWLIAPSFGPNPTRAHPLMLAPTWYDLAVPLGMGGIWLSAFLWVLKGKTLMVAHDPELLPALKQAGGH